MQIHDPGRTRRQDQVPLFSPPVLGSLRNGPTYLSLGTKRLAWLWEDGSVDEMLAAHVHEDLSLIPRTKVESQEWWHLPVPALRRQEWEDSCGRLAS